MKLEESCWDEEEWKSECEEEEEEEEEDDDDEDEFEDENEEAVGVVVNDDDDEDEEEERDATDDWVSNFNGFFFCFLFFVSVCSNGTGVWGISEIRNSSSLPSSIISPSLLQ